ncbi:MAG: inositol monophosphatase [Clostridiales bacterium]|nr:inositol monophosphatase [Clostridiales bacterium]
MESASAQVQLESIKEIILEASCLLADRQAAGHRKTKGVADYVTEVDFSVQKFIRESLEKLYPAIQFMGEEKDNAEIDMDGTVWVLDPVDGTTNLIHDYHASAISLALLERREPVLGVIYNPYLQEMYWARKGEGSFCNGEPIHVSEVKTMQESLIAIGTSPYYKHMAACLFPVFQRIFEDCQDVRRSGSAAIDLACVAAGRVEGYFEKDLKLWDFAAGMLLVREAGGRVLGYDGGELQAEMMAGVVAGNASIAQILAEEYVKNVF